MKVLVLGGTGAMGAHLIDMLDRDGFQVTVTSRSRRDSKGRVFFVQGDARDSEFSRRILSSKWDVIIDFMVYSTLEFQDRVGELLAATGQYVYLSSARVYAESNGLLTEESERLLDVSTDQRFLATDEYALSKARQENILFNSKVRNWTIIRPYITYSEQRLQLGVFEKEDWLYRALRGRSIVFSEDIASRLTTMTYGRDVAKGISAILGEESAIGESFHIASPKAISWQSVLNVYLGSLEDCLGVRPKVLLENLESFQSCHSARYQIIYDRLFNRAFNCEKIGRYVSVDDFERPEDCLRRCIEQFVKSPTFLRVSARAEARKDKLADEYTPIQQIVGRSQKLKYLAYRHILS